MRILILDSVHLLGWISLQIRYTNVNDTSSEEFWSVFNLSLVE